MGGKILSALLILLIASALYAALFMLAWAGIAYAFNLPTIPFYAWWAVGVIVTSLTVRIRNDD